MSTPTPIQSSAVDPKRNEIIKLAIMAVGGQGGGVLTGWIESLARAQGYACQATSVAGVAQRTGATIYYIEMAKAGSAQPVFGMAPASGDVDILIAAELMEAGRAIMRGFVTPDRTTLIASGHRALAVSEKTVPGDGIADGQEVIAAAEIAANRFVCFDMEALAVENDSVISATLFGALAASQTLPFAKSSFQNTIRSGRKGVEASLRAFDAAYVAFVNGAAPPVPEKPRALTVAPDAAGPRPMLDQWARLQSQVDSLPAVARPIAMAGLRKVVDFMDADYGQKYLDHLTSFAPFDNPDQNHELTKEAAKYIAKAMVYDDVIRVADLKTRGARAHRIAREMHWNRQQILHVTEFLHPRADEIVGLLPARMGQRIEANARTMAWIDRKFAKGRRLRSDRLGSFFLLYFLGGMKRYRRRNHRHAVEMSHLARWLQLASNVARDQPKLAVEIFRCHRLIKGYSDTHARGLSKFDKVVGILGLIESRPDAAEWISRLRNAALQDEDGNALDGAIQTLKSI